MLESIYIENFRCFKKTTITGFTTFNLIGGLNNSGKSALLEAIIFSTTFEKSLIKRLIQLRNIEEENPLLIEKSWDYFFYNLNTTTPIFFNCNYSGNINIKLKVKKEKITNISELSTYSNFKNDENLSVARKDFLRFLSKNKHTHSLSLYIENNKMDLICRYTYTDTGELEIKKPSPIHIPIEQIAFLPSKREIDQKILLNVLNEALALGKYNLIVSTLKKLDKSIADIRTIDKKIFLARQDMIFLPLGLFGDAVQVLLDIILALIILPNNSILIIDEIENGIHHTKHGLVFEIIFSLIKDKEIQIFATSHSSEFIHTYNNFINEKLLEVDKNKFSYFELIKTRNDSIIANKIDPETLNYKIDNQKSFRGEP